MRISTCGAHGPGAFTDFDLDGNSFCVACTREEQHSPGEEQRTTLKMIGAERLYADVQAVRNLHVMTGEQLVAAGYMQISRAYRRVARLPPGKTAIEAIKEGHPRLYQQLVEDMEESAKRNYLRLCAEKDGNGLELTEELFKQFRDAGGQSA